MRTELTYENRSINPHISRIGLFWDISTVVPGTRPLLWHAIEKCRFGWHHPILIDWETTFVLQNLFGNQRRLALGVEHSETGTRIDGPFGHGLNSKIILTQNSPRSDLSFLICRNDHPIAQIPLSATGCWSLTMPDCLMMQIGCPVKRNNLITKPEASVVALNGVRSLKVALRGGAPGPGSTALKLEPYDVMTI